jgi:hypothetical protein
MTVQSTGTRAANTEYGKMLRPRLVRGRRFAPTAVVDGKLTTGQNPQSVRATAALLIAALHHSSAASKLRQAICPGPIPDAPVPCPVEVPLAVGVEACHLRLAKGANRNTNDHGRIAEPCFGF